MTISSYSPEMNVNFGFYFKLINQWRQVKILKLRYNNIYYLFTEL